jgi:hypothetical protein
MATTTFNDLITFSRGSNATVTGPNGLIQWAPNNLVPTSQDFESANWTKNSSTITANNATAPDGTQTADTWIPTSTATAAGVRLLGAFTTVSGVIQTTSVYVKSAGKRWVYLTTPAAASNNDNCWFDLQNGVVGTVGSSALAATITPVGNGWFRLSTTSNTASVTNYVFISTTTGDNTTAVTADGTGIHVWGAQLELGSTATAYNNTSVRNLLGFSEAFDNAAWTKTNSSIVTGAQANPINGLFNAQKLMEGTATTRKTAQSAVLAAVGQTFSAYVKPAGRNFVAIGQTNGSGLWAVSLFNLSTGSYVAGYQAGGIAIPTVNQIAPVGNGWFRVSCFLNASGAALPVIMLGNGGDPIFEGYTGDGNSGVYIYGAQLSNSASLDPYVPTPGAAPSSTAYYGPRFDYDPVTLLPRGLLVEEARTNLLLYSAQFDDAYWIKSNASISANVATSPDGTSNADKIVENTANINHVIQVNTIPVTSGIPYSLSVYAKPSGRDWFAIGTVGIGTGYTYFNVANGTVGTVLAGHTATITPVGNGWYRCTISGTTTATALSIFYGPSSANANINYAGDGVSGTFIWGAQLEAGAFATSYIPTIASTVTRSADVATITGSLFSQWYNQQTGSFIAEWAINNANSTGRYIVKAFSPSVAQGYGLWLNSNSIDTRAWIGATSITAGNASLSITNRAAFGYQAANNAASVNGAAAVASSATGPTDATYLEIGSAGASYFNGHIRSIRYVPARLADFQLQALTELPLVPTLDVDFINNLYEA